MAKLVKCKSCGAEIAKSAKVCPHCGAKIGHNRIGIILAIVGLLVIFSAIFGSSDSDTPTLVTSDAPDTEASSGADDIENAPLPDTPKTTFSIGEAAELDNVVVTLVNVSENHGGNYMTPSGGEVFVICEFQIENNSDSSIAVSSILSFNAYFDDYKTSMSLSATLSTNKEQLDGTIEAGKKIDGVIGYSVDPDWKTLEIKFTPNVWSGGEFVFTYSK